MKEYIKKFKENTPEYNITYIPWIATVEATKTKFVYKQKLLYDNTE